MDKNKIQVKDLISIGIFTAIYLVVSLIAVMATGINMRIYLFCSVVISIITGPIMMLYFAKVGKKWSTLIIGVIMTVLIGFMTGGVIYTFIIGLIAAVIAEFIISSGNYKSFVKNMMGYSIFSLWAYGVIFSLYVTYDKQYPEIVKNYGLENANVLRDILNTGNMMLVFVLTLVAGVIGAYFGKALLKKHFEKAGIV